MELFRRNYANKNLGTGEFCRKKDCRGENNFEFLFKANKLKKQKLATAYKAKAVNCNDSLNSVGMLINSNSYFLVNKAIYTIVKSQYVFNNEQEIKLYVFDQFNSGVFNEFCNEAVRFGINGDEEILSFLTDLVKYAEEVCAFLKNNKVSSMSDYSKRFGGGTRKTVIVIPEISELFEGECGDEIIFALNRLFKLAGMANIYFVFGSTKFDCLDPGYKACLSSLMMIFVNGGKTQGNFNAVSCDINNFIPYGRNDCGWYKI